ncbi:MAG TPA: NAD(P)/FAD-dependent oxidoreductase [Solirubrobacteraceae bacterium]|nr:NAD(P)/FAD-dependent oxidoreductase [Solirubrobacteraceae bacterium]
MRTTDAAPPGTDTSATTMAPEHVDVLIVGAGLSGIGAACYLQRECPDRSYAILEARERIGGTWDLFRYPGVRSDSDMHTLGYSFSPWEDAKAIADGPSILRYVTETAERHGVINKVRTGHAVTRADYDSAQARWTVHVRRTEAGTESPRTLTCDFLHCCGGYYRYDAGYTPPFSGVERFPGPVVHPQQWPEDLDTAGKRVLVIGSGATAVTLVPALAGSAEHVTMLQRSPTYIVSLPSRDGIADWLRRRLPAKAAYHLVRVKNVALMTLSYQLSRRRPNLMKSVIRRGAQRQLPDGYDVDTHFKPDYNPWDQRMCVVPDGDLFAAVSSGRASIVTDTIETFTERGVQLASGGELEADVIVTATGLQMLALGGIELVIDGEPVHLPDQVVYKGMMLSGVPNFAFTVGYTNASWTLKADLTAAYVCRLLTHMRRHGYAQCMPADETPGLVREPLLNLNSGYVLRSVQDFPSQGSERPWRVHQNYALDVLDFRLGGVDDGVMRFSRPAHGDSAANGAPAAAQPALSG